MASAEYESWIITETSQDILKLVKGLNDVRKRKRRVIPGGRRSG
jgi:hypothetical protein